MTWKCHKKYGRKQSSCVNTSTRVLELCQKGKINDARHGKTDLKVFVVVLETVLMLIHEKEVTGYSDCFS